ncbi:sirohydrochlorin cobaltochelatase [Clostridium sp. CAG:242]|nr:sirohydrochlorin cobaltochelatase [Clostridium sp. CAG:242]
MSGDDDSWQQVFEAAGYETQVVLKGLGEYPSIRKIYLEHCVDCMQKLSGEISL